MLPAAYDDQTIIAQCTPSGNGALALLRLSGTDARRIAAALGKIGSSKNLLTVPSHTIHYGTIVDQHKQQIDHVLFMVMDGPQSFTGQNTVEITCHNNPFLIEAIITQALQHGARLARPGEFAERAFMNGKIDLVQAEAINDLIHANTQFALKKSLEQLTGSFSQWIEVLEKDLIKVLAWCEASFEFLDDEQEFGDRMHQELKNIIERITVLQKNFDAQNTIRQGIRIALIGSVNAGKSSLFNRLIGQQRAIVTPIAGTTRDSIEAGLYRNGAYWTLIDTAGLRQTDDIIEQEGIQRSHEQAQKADVLLLVIDSSRTMTEQEKSIYHHLLERYAQKTILVYNKTDQKAIEHDNFNTTSICAVSSLTGAGLAQLEVTLQEKIDQLLSRCQSPFLINKRHHALLGTLNTHLHAIHQMMQGPMIQYELISYHLRDALAQLSELTGKSISEAGMDAVFREFCVGK